MVDLVDDRRSRWPSRAKIAPGTDPTFNVTDVEAPGGIAGSVQLGALK
jgi:hypothetical protein